MRHVFVETNWVVAFAAPAHHRNPDALKLFDCAASGEIKLYLPVICIAEARRPIFERFQSRNQADRVRSFYRGREMPVMLMLRKMTLPGAYLTGWKPAKKLILHNSMMRSAI